MKKMNRTKTLLRLAALCLILALAVPAQAATQPDAAAPCVSGYISTCSCSTSAAGLGIAQVYFSICGTDTMDKLGARSIDLYESTDGNTWHLVENYTSSDTSWLMGYGKSSYSAHVSYGGVVGRYYKAYVSFYAEDTTGSDSTGRWTGKIQAT